MRPSLRQSKFASGAMRAKRTRRVGISTALARRMVESYLCNKDVGGSVADKEF